MWVQITLVTCPSSSLFIEFIAWRDAEEDPGESKIKKRSLRSGVGLDQTLTKPLENRTRKKRS